MLRFPAFATVLLASACLGIDLRPGLVEEWVVRHGSDSSSLTVNWIDSTVAEGGATDWTALLTLRKFATSTRYDTAVLRVFDIAYLVDSGAYRPGRHGAWLDPSCLMPFQRDDLDSIHTVLFKGTKPRRLFESIHSRMIYRMTQGAMAEFCSGSRNPEARTDVTGGWGTTCFQPWGSESQDCRPTPKFRAASGRGVVAWRSLQRQEDWRLVRFDGREVEHPPGRLLAGLLPGETWIWIQGAGNDPPLWRLTVLDRADDSVGIPGWNVEVEHRDGKGGAVRSTTRLRIDTLQGWVTLGSEFASPWAPYAKSMETRFALGFLADWSVANTDTMTLVKDGLETTVWGRHSSSTSWTLVAARNTGTLSIRSWGSIGSEQYSTSTDTRWTLASHTMRPVAVDRSPSAPVMLRELRKLCQAQPDMPLRRISLDGRSRTARGAEALRLLETKGVAVFVFGEGRRAQVTILVP